jgi:hypothetical protein
MLATMIDGGTMVNRHRVMAIADMILKVRRAKDHTNYKCQIKP